MASRQDLERRLQIGERIAQAREAAGLTQMELGHLIGIKQPQSISRYERGETAVKIRRLERIAQATKVSPGWLLGQENHPEAGSEGPSLILPNIEQVVRRIVELGPAAIHEHRVFLETLLGAMRRGVEETEAFLGEMEALIEDAASEERQGSPPRSPGESAE